MGKRSSSNTTTFSKSTSTTKAANTALGGIATSAEVVDIILDPGHPAWSPQTNLIIGSVKARPLKSFNAKTDDLQWYQPLLANFYTAYPLIGEIILLIDAIGQDGEQSTRSTEKYYLPPINVFQDQNNNQLPASSFDINLGLASQAGTDTTACDPSGQYSSNVDAKNEPVDLTPQLGRTFQEANIATLIPYEGDVFFNGRAGQSIRFGSTNIGAATPNYWSGAGTVGDPIIIMSNGHNRPEGSDFHIEDINHDAGTMFICGGQAVEIAVATDPNWDSYEVEYEKASEEERIFDFMNDKEIEKIGPAKPFEPPNISEENDEPVEVTPEDIKDIKDIKTTEALEVNKTKNAHTCGTESDFNEDACMEIVLNTIAGGGSKKYDHLGWMGKNDGKSGPNWKTDKGGFNSGGGECWVGILHWTGRSTATLYAGMKSTGMIRKYWPDKVTIPNEDPSKGYYYDGKYAGKTLTVTEDVLNDFCKNANYKELLYDWWAKPMKRFVESGSDSEKAQKKAVWLKFGKKVATYKGKGGWKTKREYAIAMFFLNSYGAPLYTFNWYGSEGTTYENRKVLNRGTTKMVDSMVGENCMPVGDCLEWDAEALMKYYCGGMIKDYNGPRGDKDARTGPGEQQVSCCRSRCLHVNKHYPPCCCRFDETNELYREFVFGGCGKTQRGDGSLDGTGDVPATCYVKEWREQTDYGPEKGVGTCEAPPIPTPQPKTNPPSTDGITPIGTGEPCQCQSRCDNNFSPMMGKKTDTGECDCRFFLNSGAEILNQAGCDPPRKMNGNCDCICSNGEFWDELNQVCISQAEKTYRGL